MYCSRFVYIRLGIIEYGELRGYRRELNKFLSMPLRKSVVMLVFLWFSLFEWLFRMIIFGTWVLHFVAPFLVGQLTKHSNRGSLSN